MSQLQLQHQLEYKNLESELQLKTQELQYSMEESAKAGEDVKLLELHDLQQANKQLQETIDGVKNKLNIYEKELRSACEQISPNIDVS